MRKILAVAALLGTSWMRPQLQPAFFTYSGAAYGYAPRLPIYDLTCLYGAAGATVYVDEVRLSGTYLSDGADGGGGTPYTRVRMGIAMYSSQPSGAAGNTGNAGRHDSTAPPNAAVFYSFNDTETSTGNLVRVLKVYEGRLGDGMQPIVLYESTATKAPITLRGANEGVCVFGFGYSLPNLWYLDTDITWRESIP
jgi:hypothetical protein